MLPNERACMRPCVLVRACQHERVCLQHVIGVCAAHPAPNRSHPCQRRGRACEASPAGGESRGSQGQHGSPVRCKQAKRATASQHLQLKRVVARRVVCSKDEQHVARTQLAMKQQLLHPHHLVHNLILLPDLGKIVAHNSDRHRHEQEGNQHAHRRDSLATVCVRPADGAPRLHGQRGEAEGHGRWDGVEAVSHGPCTLQVRQQSRHQHHTSEHEVPGAQRKQ
eukprot:5104056-Prymnesium_polylepis.1